MATPDRRLFSYLDAMQNLLDFYRENDLLPAWQKELEYTAARYLLATFLKRAARLPAAEFREAKRRAEQFMRENFPGWRRNPYLKTTGARGWYLKTYSPLSAALMRIAP